jgi:hypothetical protein
MVTHTFSEVKKESYSSSKNSNPLAILGKSEHENILVHPKTPSAFKSFNNNGIIDAIVASYSNHVPLKLRPEDILVAVTTAFGKYIVTHSEEMRKYFVSHEGRKEVKIFSPDLCYEDLKNPEIWKDRFANPILDQISEMCDKELLEWYTPQFISQLLTLGAVKEYFSCSWELGCGFSEITLDGTEDDWVQLRSKMNYLERFDIPDIQNWRKLLCHVLDEFVNFWNCEMDVDFWQKAVTYKRRGSGAQKSYCGWMLVFAPFDDDGKSLLYDYDSVMKNDMYGYVSDDSITNCVLNLPIKVIADDERTVDIYVGSWMFKYEDEQISPHLSYLIVDKPYITFELFHEGFTKAAENIDIKVLYLNHIDKYVKFTYYFAEFCNIPQDRYCYLYNYIGYIWYNKDKFAETPTYEQFYKYVKETFLSKYDVLDFGTSLRKYIPISQVECLVKQTLEKIE